MTADRPGVVGVYETVLYAPELEECARFYADVLGLRRISTIGELGFAFRLPDGGMLLLFDPVAAGEPGRFVPPHGTTGPGHVAFAVGELDGWLALLAEHGVEVELDTTWRAGGRSVYFRDPAGNSLELVAGEAWPD